MQRGPLNHAHCRARRWLTAWTTTIRKLSFLMFCGCTLRVRVNGGDARARPTTPARVRPQQRRLCSGPHLLAAAPLLESLCDSPTPTSARIGH
jgi:hypothetical protein